jgi:hypothetical protein
MCYYFVDDNYYSANSYCLTVNRGYFAYKNFFTDREFFYVNKYYYYSYPAAVNHFAHVAVLLKAIDFLVFGIDWLAVIFVALEF